MDRVQHPEILPLSYWMPGSLLLAHEIGHAFGLLDIYRNLGLTYGLDAIEEGSHARQSWMPLDWNCSGALAPRYYDSDTSQISIIGKLLMHGAIDEFGSGLDIPRGPVYGVRKGLQVGQAPAIDMVKVGLDTVADEGREPKH